MELFLIKRAIKPGLNFTMNKRGFFGLCPRKKEGIRETAF
jgi:hypothetical protein